MSRKQHAARQPTDIPSAVPPATAPGSLCSPAVGSIVQLSTHSEPVGAPVVAIVSPPMSLCAEIAAAARAAEKAGDHVGHALMCEAEVHLGQLRARLREQTGNYSPAVIAMADKLKSML